MKRHPLRDRSCSSLSLSFAVASVMAIGLSARVEAQVVDFQSIKPSQPAAGRETDVRVLKVPEVVGTHALQQAPVNPGLIEEIKNVRDSASHLHSGSSVNTPGHAANGAPHLPPR